MSYLPLLALATALVTVVLVLRKVIVDDQMARRPVLLLGLVCAALVPIYLCLVWVQVVPDTYLRLERPWASLVGFAAMLFVTRRLCQHPLRASRGRTTIHDLLLTTTVMSCALAATTPELGRPLDRMSLLVVIDRSRSIDLVPHATTRIERELRAAEHSMRPGDRLGTVVFAADALAEQPLRPKSSSRTAQKVTVGRDGTNIAFALERALAQVPADSATRMVLFSDGVASSTLSQFRT